MTKSDEINKNEKPMTVFISYSWDDEEHKKWILDLANKLTTDGGIYVRLDRYDLKTGNEMTHFMEKSVNLSDKVILIMTPNYKDKADNRRGGVGYEYSMITQNLYENLDNEKFIPVLRKGSYDESAPHFLKSFISHDMTIDTSFENDFKNLLRIIYDEPELVRPKLGTRPQFVNHHKNTSSTALINDQMNLKNTGMTTFAKWTFDIKIRSLADQSKPELLKLFNENILVDKTQKHAQ